MNYTNEIIESENFVNFKLWNIVSDNLMNPNTNAKELVQVIRTMILELNLHQSILRKNIDFWQKQIEKYAENLCTQKGYLYSEIINWANLALKSFELFKKEHYSQIIQSTQKSLEIIPVKFDYDIIMNSFRKTVLLLFRCEDFRKGLSDLLLEYEIGEWKTDKIAFHCNKMIEESNERYSILGKINGVTHLTQKLKDQLDEIDEKLK